MKINEAEKRTGLTKKAIRFYEAKGLISVPRRDNGYRDYSEEDVRALARIRQLRAAGVSIPDIGLFLSGVLTREEVLEKRRREIERESGRSSAQYAYCDRLAGESDETVFEGAPFTESEEVPEAPLGALAVGIDLGTTTVSAAVMDLDRRVQVEVYTVPHAAYVKRGTFSEQSVSVILGKAEGILRHIAEHYEGIVSIGITGQMHGIVYLDRAGDPLSNLINWQDKRGDLPLPSGKSACEEILARTGERVATGYGAATLYYDLVQGGIPQGTASVCSVMDLLGMRLTGKTAPVSHPSVAASFGFFDRDAGRFRTEKLAALGIDGALFPRVSGEGEVLGVWRGIPVSVAIGDNQASFFGAVGNHREDILVNVGTGSQISAMAETCGTKTGGESLVAAEQHGDGTGAEVRPLLGNAQILCGSALGGGSAYALLERFFRSYAAALGAEDTPQYAVMNALAERAYERGEPPLSVDTSFYGTRTDPTRRGAIESIDGENFTPAALILGVLRGICDELYGLYRGFGIERTRLVASGGAVRRNAVLRRMLGERFGMEVLLPSVEEEAATGAALYSAFAVGRIAYTGGFSAYVSYESCEKNRTYTNESEELR